MIHKKGNSNDQHRLISGGGINEITGLSSWTSSIPYTVDGLHPTNSPYLRNVITSGDPMVVCNMFDQYLLSESKVVTIGCCTPDKYSSKTYGRNVRTGVWYKLDLFRGFTMSSGKDKWYHRWQLIDQSEVPLKFQTAALLLS